MELYASCDCGWRTQGIEADVFRSLRDHGITVHGIALTDEQILAVARPVAPGSIRDDEASSEE